MAPDDGFREIQLNGKQLVFLFMATTIVAVVIFLCGVMVGRGVRNNTTAVAADTSAARAPAGDLTAVPPDVQAGARGTATPAPPPPPAPVEDAGGDNGKASPGPAAATTTPTRVGQKAAAPDAAAEKSTAPGARAQNAPATAVAGQVPAAVPATGLPAEPAGRGFALQVAALNEKGQAEAIARRLLEKGYAAYVVAPPAAGGMFRVRVGKFKERREADAVVRRLKKEEQLEPWIIPPTR